MRRRCFRAVRSRVIDYADGLEGVKSVKTAKAKLLSPTIEVVDRRTQKKQRTREQIIDAAIALFVEQGYDATTVDQIAEAADISRKTFFNHFPEKDLVADAWAAQRRNDFRTYLNDATQPEVAAKLDAAARQLAADYDADSLTRRPMILTWIRCGGPLVHYDNDAHVIEAFLDEGKARGELPGHLDSASAATILQDALFGAIYRWAASSNDTLTGHFARVLDTLLPALLHAPNRAEPPLAAPLHQ